MEVELLEIRDFLAAHHPFDQLPAERLSELPGKLEVRYIRRDETILEPGAVNTHLYIIRTGAVDILTADTNDLLARLGEGDVFGHRALMREGKVENRVSAIEDTLVYQLDAEEIDKLCDRHAQFAYFFGPLGGGRLREAVEHSNQEQSDQLNLMTTPIRELTGGKIISIPPSATIREAAQCMSEERVSSIMIGDGNQLVGILTDRDLRNRVVASGIDYNQPVTEVMTSDPMTIDAGSFAFEALLVMARKNIHHLPVVDGDKMAGMITATDLTQRQTTSAVYLVGDIYKQESIERLQEASAQAPQLLVNMVDADASPASVGHVITAVGDAITIRLLQLAEEKLGAPPIPYAWLAAGSQARNEQTAHSDQDNCLLMGDEYDPEQHGDYFKELARFVTDGLNDCGYVYCPGEMMAITDEWRQPLKTWKKYFNKWIEQPEPKALMLTCVFFDLRCIYGEKRLFRNLRSHILEKTQGNRIFLAYMAANALSHTPPLGFFRNFVLIKSGDHNHTFDMKHNGIVPVVDLARVYALSAGVNAVNTQDRLVAATGGGEVSSDGAMDLQDALDFISTVRLKHQARLIKAGKPADNFISPKDLSHFERNHLKDAFSVVRTLQSALGSRFQVGRF